MPAVVVLRRRLVGIDCCLWSKLLPAAAMGDMRNHAGFAMFRSVQKGWLARPMDRGLTWVRIRTRLDELSARDWLQSSGSRIQFGNDFDF